jgi:hypothetical protein
MKFTLLVLLVIVISIQGKSQASFGTSNIARQEPVITLSVKNESLEEVLKKLKKQGDYHFNYVTEDIARIKNVTINVKNVTIKTVATVLERDYRIKFDFVDNSTIIVLLNK